MNDDLEPIAQQIAARGRDALVERLRHAYAQAAAAHSDLIDLEGDRIEELVQRSADRADGLQWRRALADVAVEELGITLVEALHHPVVELAQELAGAPSYEESLTELTRRPAQRIERIETAARAEPFAGEAAARAAGRGAGAAIADQERAEAAEPGRAEPGEEEDLRVTAIHLGGVANLPAWQSGIDLRVSIEGLDIIRGESEIVGRLAWPDIDTIEVPLPRARRRRQSGRARLVVRTRNGDASFEVPAFSSDELRERLDPLVARFSRA